MMMYDPVNPLPLLAAAHLAKLPGADQSPRARDDSVMNAVISFPRYQTPHAPDDVGSVSAACLSPLTFAF